MNKKEQILKLRWSLWVACGERSFWLERGRENIIKANLATEQRNIIVNQLHELGYRPGVIDMY